MLEKIALVSDDWAEVWNKSKDLIEKKKERKKENVFYLLRFIPRYLIF